MNIQVRNPHHLQHRQLLLNLLLLAGSVGELLNIVTEVEDVAVQQVLQLEHVLSKVAADQQKGQQERTMRQVRSRARF